MATEYKFDPCRLFGFTCKTFSVGVYPVVPTKDGTRTKKGKAVVRVSGKQDDADIIHLRAAEIAAQLTAGTYTGPKHVKVK
jgi:hypothetical protein